ncbi:FAD-dependent monooxygenase [Caulobacter segnis]
MKQARILIIGGGIGGLTSAIALRNRGFEVELIERDPTWSVYGVGIIQQSNVVRAVAALGILDDYLEAGFGYDHVEVYLPDGRMVAKIPSPKLAGGYPANVGIARPALHKVLGDRAKAAGASIRLGLTATALEEDVSGVAVTFSDETKGRYDLVIGADGLYSATRKALFPGRAAAGTHRPVGVRATISTVPPTSSASRRSKARPASASCPCPSSGCTCSSPRLEEPGKRRFEREGLAAAMRQRLAKAPPRIAALAGAITDDDEVVYKPLESLFVEGAWSKGRVVLIGDAIHATTPHLGQGAGMAIEDLAGPGRGVVRGRDPSGRFRRVRELPQGSLPLHRRALACDLRWPVGQRRPLADTAAESRKMFEVTAQPI